jgi:hypothetical protein
MDPRLLELTADIFRYRCNPAPDTERIAITLLLGTIQKFSTDLS